MPDLTVADPPKALGVMTDDELAAEEARLAALRTAVRLAQNEVTAERELRAVAAKLSGAARERFVARIEIGGGIVAHGGAAAEGKDA